MIEGIIKGLLGPSLAPLYDYIKTHPVVVALVLFAIVAIYVAGRIQLNNITRKTQVFVLERYKEEVRRRPNITAAGFYKQIYPDWTVQIKKWAAFIPDKHDLWPVRVTPENVQKKFAFSAEWIDEVIKKDHLKSENSKTGSN